MSFHPLLGPVPVRRTLVRTCLVGGCAALVAVGVWAAPADTEVPVIETTAVAAAPTPEVALPDVGEGTTEAVRFAVTTDEPVAAEPVAGPAPGAASTPPAEPDHLSPEPDPNPSLAEVAVTTTTAAPAPTTTKAAVATVAFTATQRYGSCGEAVPYDVFSGTATPGSTVTISSSHGSGSTVADASGHWSRTVEFPSAPENQPFTVTVSGLGGSTTLSFVATGDGHA
ncbi:MAG: hypothetical protein AAGE98_07775 [Actinomycetota bacterium]